MGNKSIRVSPATLGDDVAVRDGHALDDGGLPRLIQQIDFSSGHLQAEIMRGFAQYGLSSVDPAGLWFLPSDFEIGIKTVGDKTNLMVTPFFRAADQSVSVTPVITYGSQETEVQADIVVASGEDRAIHQTTGPAYAYYNFEAAAALKLGDNSGSDEWWHMLARFMIPYDDIANAVWAVTRRGATADPSWDQDDVKIYGFFSTDGAWPADPADFFGSGVLTENYVYFEDDITSWNDYGVKKTENLAGLIDEMRSHGAGLATGVPLIFVIKVNSSSGSPYIPVAQFTYGGTSYCARLDDITTLTDVTARTILTTKESLSAPANMYSRIGVTNWWVGPTMAWDVLGATQVGLHITALDSTGVRLMGGFV